MFNPLIVVIVLLIYFGLLFLLALWVEARSTLSRRLSRSPLVYALSLAVFCTSWTYYGSVGKTVTSGMLFMTVYIGPTLIIVLWWQIMRRMVRIKDRYHITSVADFISARYGRSTLIAALATGAALAGSMPYLALQIKSVVATFNVIAGGPGPTTSWVHGQVGPLTVVLMAGFTILIGVRRLDPTERHHGMITVVAVESVVKLVAFLACGVFITFVVHRGFGDIFSGEGVPRIFVERILSLAGTEEPPYATWTVSLFLSMAAIMFLPHQFHVTVIENSDERHLRTAMWVFPLYILLITVFVAPIALEGLRVGFAPSMADTFLLRLPMWYDQPVLALLVYIGGASAAMSMVMISSMTLSTMLTNHLLLPVVGRFESLGFLRRHLLRMRWFAVAAVILGGYWFERAVGDAFMLVNLGMLSFAAALQFAPAILGGLFWEEGNRTGAALGLIGGCAVWLYTLVIPAFALSGTAFGSLTANGPFGIGWLRPEALFGLTAMGPLGQSVFWSLAVNLGLYLSGSLLCPRCDPSSSLAGDFVNILRAPDRLTRELGEPDINLKSKTRNIVGALKSYVSDGQAGVIFVKSLKRAGLLKRRRISLAELADLLAEVESTLAGSVGAAEAHAALDAARIYTDEERARLSRLYADIMADLKVTPGELTRRMAQYGHREAALTSEAEILEEHVRARTEELETVIAEMETFAHSLSHDLREPLADIAGHLHDLYEHHREGLGPEGCERLEKARLSGLRMRLLIDDLLTLAQINRLGVERETVDLGEIMLDELVAIRAHDQTTRVDIEIGPDLKADADPKLVRLLMTHLVGNAWKFVGRTENARISLHSEERDGRTWFLLSDNGAGFDMRRSERLFQPFSRLHSQDEFAGTGIGLAIAARAVRKHGGRIEARGEVNQGATFSFTLQPENEQPPAAPATA